MLHGADISTEGCSVIVTTPDGKVGTFSATSEGDAKAWSVALHRTVADLKKKSKMAVAAPLEVPDRRA